MLCPPLDFPRLQKNMTTTNRPSRGRKKIPSASYYLGYVEDDESIESIMQKFDELEKLKSSNLSECAASSSSSKSMVNGKGKEPAETTLDGGAITPLEEDSYLNEELQEELFKRTSHHSIQSNIYSEIMSNYNTEQGELDEMDDGDGQEASDYSSDEDYVDNFQDGESDGSTEENLNICVSDSEIVNEESFDEEEEEEIIDDEESSRAKKKRKSNQTNGRKRNTQKKGDNTIKDLVTLDPNMNFLNSFEGNSTTNSKKSRATSNIEIVNIPTAEKILNSWAKHIQRVTPKECKKYKAYSECQTIDLTNFEEDLSGKLMFNRTNSKKSSTFVSSVYTFDTEEDVIITNRVLDYNFKSICKNQPFEGILIDPPYHSIQVKDLKTTQNLHIQILFENNIDMKKYTVSASLSREDEKDFFTTKKVNSTTDDFPESTTTSSIYNNKQRRGIVHRSQTQLQANKQVQIIEELKEEEEEPAEEETVQNKQTTRPIGIKTTTIIEPSSVNDSAENSISDASVVSSVAASSLSSNTSSSVASSVESNPSSSPIIKKKKFTFGGLIKRKQNADSDASSPNANGSASPNLNDSPNSTSTTNFESNSLPKRPQVISVNDGSDFRKKLQDRKRNAGGTGMKIVKQNDQLIVSQNNSTLEE
ncbi:predicted protein [Naegleria gruberi]|uniref:Predicted protein n=1 Tax=Naegleria gruberi TaxID=5762 RepID=D2V3A9_NAEGR|nr:uncharacterized protein NAEGRDRAFT_46356 [Naegleria gruberi]EFC48606.1 predicted protein [Naegleria gruberi]|eukprot:XP_002681350.1 predicted protein [Naegleria gruberi strain NEG-M]